MPLFKRPGPPPGDDENKEVASLRCPKCQLSKSAWGATKEQALAKAELDLEIHWLAEHANDNNGGAQ